MARERRDPSPAPPPPPQESSSDEVSEEEEPPRAVAGQKPPQNPRPHHPAAAADDVHSDAEVHYFQMRRCITSPAKPDSDADAEEEDGESTKSEPEVPEPMQKAAAAAAKKGPAPEAAVSGKVTSSGKVKKPGRSPRTWSKEDWIRILDALAAHVKSQGALPKTGVLIAAVRDRLDRKDCNYTDMYEAVRRLKTRYEKAVKTGVVPSAEDELQMYNLSEAIWGDKAKEAIAAAASQNDANVTKSKKGQGKKEKMNRNSKGGTLKEVANENGDPQKWSKKGQANEKKTEDEETHQEETEREPTVLRSFDELQNLYPNLAGCVEMIEAQHPCGEMLKRALEFIGDDKASALESKIKKSRILAVKVHMRRGDIRKEVLNLVIGMSD